MEKISVLMPVYLTQEQHLREAMESILAQTFGDFEFLILNDSPEAAYIDDIVASYADSRIRYFRNAENIGISESRNKLIDLARGEYLAVMDHDDISCPERFEKQVAFLDSHPEVGVVGCHSETISESLKKRKLYTPPVKDHDIKVSLIRNCVILHPTAMIRKCVLLDNNIRYEACFSPAEDYALWCRLIPCTRFYNVPEVLFKYREHETNTSKVKDIEMVKSTIAIHAFVEVENPVLFREYQDRAIHKTRIRLFGFIPFITIKVRRNRGRVFLFEVIPLFTFKKVSVFKD